MRKLIFLTVILALFTFSKGESFAFENASGSSATLKSPFVEQEVDHRAKILKEFLEQYNSPLAPHANTFIESADKHNLDWRLVASIAGLESTFGKHRPIGSHNGWGWGYNNGTVLHFESWDAAIEEISRGLRENYLFDREESDPYVIGPKYAASPTWAQRVTYFMNQIETYRINNSVSTLTLDI